VRHDEQAKSFVNSTTGLKHSRLSMFCLYLLIEIVVQHFSFFTPASFLTNLLLDQPDRQKDPAGQLQSAQHPVTVDGPSRSLSQS